MHHRGDRGDLSSRQRARIGAHLIDDASELEAPVATTPAEIKRFAPAALNPGDCAKQETVVQYSIQIYIQGFP